jgi:FAD:protein FMN transferase
MSGRTLTRVRPRMGTLLAVTLRADARGTGGTEPAAFGTAFEVARRAEALLSAHDPASILNEMNRRAGAEAVVSRDLAAVMRTARRLAHATDGAFDPTVGALLRLWARAARGGVVPSRLAVARAGAAVDWRAIEVSGDRTRLARRGVRVDLGAFGKGVALDAIARALTPRGVSGVLNFGESSLCAVGAAPAAGWRIILRHPHRGFAGSFVLRRGACSTSATRGGGLRIGRRVIGHVVDPRTGWPVRGRAQVTVVAASAAVAEAASTALLVLGPGALDPLAERLGIAACWIDGPCARTTRGFVLEPAA